MEWKAKELAAWAAIGDKRASANKVAARLKRLVVALETAKAQLDKAHEA